MCQAVFGASEHVFGELHIRALKRAKMPCGKKIQFLKTSNRTVKLGNFFSLDDTIRLLSLFLGFGETELPPVIL